MYDLAGRVVKQVPAPRNLVVPNYRFVGDMEIEIAGDS
jgi:Rieske Fe-S protein